MTPKDVNDDGYRDLIVQVEDVDGDYQEGDTLATVTAVTYEGMQIMGTDTICVVP